MALTEAVGLAPIAYTFCANALRQSDASLEAAAQVCGAGPLRILRSVIVPMLRPPIVYSTILVVSISIETLSVPLLYGEPVHIEVFSTFLYTNGLKSIHPDYGVLGAASTPILLVTIGLVALQAKLLRNVQRFVSVRGKATRVRPLDLGRLKWVSVVLITLYVVLGALVPIGGLVFRSFTQVFTPLQSPFKTLTADNYDRIFSYPVYVQSIRNSLIVAAVGAVLVSVLSVPAVMVARRSSFRFARAVEYLALAPQAMPGIIIGIGLFWALAFAPFGIGGLVQNTLWAIIIGFGLRAMPGAFGSLSPSLMQIGREPDNAGRVSGADWLRTFVQILARLLRLRRRADPHLRDDAQGVHPRGVPRLRRHQRHRHHDARAVGPGEHRLGRGAGHPANHHHRGRRRGRGAAHERAQGCLRSPSRTCPRGSPPRTSCTAST